VRTEGGERTLHHGPFAETKEQLGAYYLIDVPNLDAAIASARRIPMPGTGIGGGPAHRRAIRGLCVSHRPTVRGAAGGSCFVGQFTLARR
jgi:hypothetical protein